MINRWTALKPDIRHAFSSCPLGFQTSSTVSYVVLKEHLFFFLFFSSVYHSSVLPGDWLDVISEAVLGKGVAHSYAPPLKRQGAGEGEGQSLPHFRQI